MVNEIVHHYPSDTPAQARASLMELQKRRDQGKITTDDYLDIRRRLVRASLPRVLAEPKP